ncbi:MAG: ABC transporter substrate-binding protein [Alphaproteobacteria bacterium]|nr:ABC transporter substrate-binding protein [Alphaproteobacteria bacterium]MBT4084633.1 ABC transporter substrate-binding protein [Alphaproteobacteria bacterium]MBT6386343.1 ABC transporter substrate-binding protein [Alphaproteobacteria bacterium]MBT7743768.1 ABC transporter substrate-binding protein [Alphaproteobacteria bacterium]
MKIKTTVAALSAAVTVAGTLALASTSAQAAECKHKIGAVLSLTGSYGAYGVPISKAAQMGVEQVNAARMAASVGCDLAYDVRDSQTQASVAVDAARKMIDLEGVTAMVGPISSGITAPLLSSVTVEKNVILIATASTSSTFTEMGRQGKTKGLFFRTLPADSLQAVATAKLAWDVGYRNPAIIYLNNDWGKHNQAEFKRAFAALGGKIAAAVAFNADQPSYRSEINKALKGNPDSLYLVSQPQDGTKQIREWIKFEGPSKYVFPQGMNDTKFVNTIGPDLLKDGWFMSPGQPDTPSITTMEADYQKRFDLSPKGPGRNSGYDSGVLLGLAMVLSDIQGKDIKGGTLAAHVRAITGSTGEKVYAGVAGLTKAINLLKAGKKIQYVGATGPINFDEYGDVAQPFVGMKFKGGDFSNEMAISLDDVAKVKAMIK